MLLNFRVSIRWYEHIKYILRYHNFFNLINGGLRSDHIKGVCVILHTPSNFWTTDDRELKFYMVIDIHNLF